MCGIVTDDEAIRRSSAYQRNVKRCGCNEQCECTMCVPISEDTQCTGDGPLCASYLEVTGDGEYPVRAGAVLHGGVSRRGDNPAT